MSKNCRQTVWPISVEVYKFNMLFIGHGWETCMDGEAHCQTAGTFTRWRCSTKYLLVCGHSEWFPLCQPSQDMFLMQLREFFRRQKWHGCVTGEDLVLHIAGMIQCCVLPVWFSTILLVLFSVVYCRYDSALYCWYDLVLCIAAIIQHSIFIATEVPRHTGAYKWDYYYYYYYYYY